MQKELKLRQKHMQTTKDKILSVVVDYIKEGANLKSITLAQIAAEAKIGKSTVYEYFASKEQLVFETYKYLLTHYKTILTSEITDMRFKQAFFEQLKKILVVMKDARLIMDAIMNSSYALIPTICPELEDMMRHIQHEMNQRFESIIYLGVVEGVLEAKEPKPYIKHVIQALISGLLFQYVNQEIDLEEEALLELVYKQLIYSLKQ